MDTILLSIDYDEGEAPESYRGVTQDRAGVKTRFCSDRPERDYFRALVASLDADRVFLTSSVDHFVMDCDGLYEWVVTEWGCIFGELTKVDWFVRFVLQDFTPDQIFQCGGWNRMWEFALEFFQFKGIPSEEIDPDQFAEYREEFNRGDWRKKNETPQLLWGVAFETSPRVRTFCGCNGIVS